jgi:hypothetical protein
MLKWASTRLHALGHAALRRGGSWPLFIPEVYAARAGIPLTRSVFAHYETTGWKQGLSPSPFFDVPGYLKAYPDVRAAGVEPLAHYLFSGWREGRVAVPGFKRAGAGARSPLGLNRDAEYIAFVKRYMATTRFRERMTQVDPATLDAEFAEYVKSEMRLGRAWAAARALGTLSPAALARAKSRQRAAMRAAFDEGFYRATYMAGDPAGDAFECYLAVGAAAGHDPSPKFSEAFYRAFHGDVAEAVEKGVFASGFEHYVLTGQAEGRLARRDDAAVLEMLLPGVTAPALLRRLGDIGPLLETFSARAVAPEARAGRVWIVLPFLAPELFFGGFASVLAFAERLLARGASIGFVLRAGPATQYRYFLYRIPADSPFHAAGERVAVVSMLDQDVVDVHPDDVFVTYSVQDEAVARDAVALTRAGRPVCWIQEYEPAFHAHDAVHMLAAETYTRDHVGVFNSAALLSWFRHNRVGRYGAAEPPPHLAYEHLLWHPPGAARATLDPSRRTLFLYARPEAHAARNLFEIAILALRRAVAAGVFSPAWRFVAIGAIGGPHVVDLAEGRTIELRNRVPAQEYAALIGEVDVLLSLMYAPHPSLLPFEVARAGGIAVTNTFPNRDVAWFARRSANIVPCEPTLDGVVAALTEAVRRADARAERAPEPQSDEFPDNRDRGWEAVFHDAFFDRLEAMVGVPGAFGRAPA